MQSLARPRGASIGGHGYPRRSKVRGRVVLRAEGQAEGEQEIDQIPPGCSRYIAKISKPIGIVLEEGADGNIRVGEIKPGGNAERWNDSAEAASQIRPKDQLVAVSGFTRTGSAQMYGMTEVKGGEKIVRIVVGSQERSKRFDVVVSAIGSHLAGMDCTLEFQRCE
jgi:hypothetical protein